MIAEAGHQYIVLWRVFMFAYQDSNVVAYAGIISVGDTNVADELRTGVSTRHFGARNESHLLAVGKDR